MNRRTFTTAGAVGLASAIVGVSAGHASIEMSRPIDPAEFDAMRRFADLPQGRIAYIERGSGLAALFIHGWPLNGYQWRGAIEQLSPHRRCIAPDLMGLGYSEVAEGRDLSPGAQAETLLALLDRLGFTSVDLVANDSGITIAQILAARHPTRVRSMLLTNGDVHQNSPPEALLPAIEDARQGKLAATIERHFTEPGFAASPEGLGGICYTHPANLSPQSMRVYFAPLLVSARRRKQFQDYGVAFLPNPLPALEEDLRKSTIPVRIIWGDADPLFALEWAHWLDKAFPRSRGVRRVQGAKLFFPEEFPDIVAEEAIMLWSIANNA